jgi:ribosomal protein RSM22 (predicted rRNA methylase)
MSAQLPVALRAAIEKAIAEAGRAGLPAASAAITQHYRDQNPSRTVINSGLAVAAYLSARLPATYAAVRAALAAVTDVHAGLSPRSLLDVGAGPGSATFAALDVWPQIEALTLFDHNDAFMKVAGRLLAETRPPGLGDATLLRGETADLPALAADLVIASYVLVELNTHAVDTLIPKLLVAATGVLLLVEPGTPAGYARILQARGIALKAGAHVLAPCTHGLECPSIAPDWCHFSQRLARSRDHMRAKSASVPFEDEKYCYLAVSRQPVSIGGGRIVAPVHETKAGMTFKVCREGQICEEHVPSRDREAFRRVRRMGWADRLV